MEGHGGNLKNVKFALVVLILLCFRIPTICKRSFL